MQEITAKLNHLRISPRKVRSIAKPLKGLSVFQADAQLRAFHRGASEPLRKLIASAAANAEHNYHLEKDGLYISKITVDPGPTLKRILPRAFGSPTPLLKRTSHVSVFLASRKSSKAKPKVRAIPRPIETQEVSPTPEEKRQEIAEVRRNEEASGRRRLPRGKKVTKVRTQTPSVFRRVFRRKAM